MNRENGRLLLYKEKKGNLLHGPNPMVNSPWTRGPYRYLLHGLGSGRVNPQAQRSAQAQTAPPGWARPAWAYELRVMLGLGQNVVSWAGPSCLDLYGFL